MERKLSIESPSMNLHTVLEHAKKLEDMIVRISERYGLNLDVSNMFSFERELDLKLNGMAEIDEPGEDDVDDTGDEENDDLGDEDMNLDSDKDEGDADAEESQKPEA